MRGKLAKIIAKGADERQSVAGITADMSKGSSRTPWPCVHLLLQAPVMFLQWICVCAWVLRGRMSVEPFLCVVSQRRTVVNVAVCAGAQVRSQITNPDQGLNCWDQLLCMSYLVSVIWTKPQYHLEARCLWIIRVKKRIELAYWAVVWIAGCNSKSVTSPLLPLIFSPFYDIYNSAFLSKVFIIFCKFPDKKKKRKALCSAEINCRFLKATKKWFKLWLSVLDKLKHKYLDLCDVNAQVSCLNISSDKLCSCSRVYCGF